MNLMKSSRLSHFSRLFLEWEEKELRFPDIEKNFQFSCSTSVLHIPSCALNSIVSFCIACRKNMSTIIKIPEVHQPTRNSRMRNGLKIGFCRICTCFNLEFIATRCGIIKLFEIILGSCCETLMIRFGIPASQDIGEAFFSFHSTVSACLATTTILYLSYLFSAKTYNLLRKSVFVSEIVKSENSII